MDPNNEYRLSSWLAQQEDKHKVNILFIIIILTYLVII